MLMAICRKFYPSDLSFLLLQILWKIIVIDFVGMLFNGLLGHVVMMTFSMTL